MCKICTPITRKQEEGKWRISCNSSEISTRVTGTYYFSAAVFFCVWLIGQEAVAKVPRGIHEKPQMRTGITNDGTSESCEKDIDDR